MNPLRKLAQSLLGKSTRLFETDMNYVVKGSFWMIGAQAIASLSGFALSIAFAQFLPKEAYGNYKYVLSLAALLAAFSLSGLSTSVVQSTARGFYGLFKKSFGINLRWSIGIIVASLGISIYYFSQENYILAVSMIAVAIFSPLLNGALLYKSFLNGKKDFYSTAMYSIPANIIPAIIIIGTLLLTQNPFYSILAYLGGNALISFIINRRIARTHELNDEIDDANLTYSKHLSAINVLDTITTNLDKVLLFQYLGATSLSLYSFATAFPEQLRNLLKIVPILAIPKLSEKSMDDIHKVIYKKIFKLFLITIPVIIVYFFLAPFLYSIFFPQYMEVVLYSQVFALILLVEGGLPGSVFKARMAIREQYILNITSNIVKIVLLIVLIIFYGIWGVIFSRILSRFFSFTLSLILLKKIKTNETS